MLPCSSNLSRPGFAETSPNKSHTFLMTIVSRLLAFFIPRLKTRCSLGFTGEYVYNLYRGKQEVA